ncbi:MAG: alpha-E domain-containing protein [Chloroflexota bacterium]|nr:alpha-E domain-containing protein [Chloroflexota bacterium]
MLARVAEDLFWMSRYVERAVAVARLIDVTLHLELDDGDPDDAMTLWTPLLRPALGEKFSRLSGPGGQSAAGGHPSTGANGADSDGGDEGDEGDEGDDIGNVLTLLTAPVARDVRYDLAFNEDNPGSMAALVRRARAAARGVRECISSEMWEQLNTLYLSLVKPQVAAEAEEDPHSFHKHVREGAQFFHGLADATLAHDEAWHFITLGKYLERAGSVARVLNLETHLLMPGATSRGGDEIVRWLAVLRSCGSAEAYARYYSLRVEPARVVEFLLLNPVFPQSVRFSLNAAWDALAGIAERGTIFRDGARGADPAVRALGLLRARLEHAAVDEVLDEGLDSYLSDVQERIEVVAQRITHSYLRREPQTGRVVGIARAAMMMAGQQQQQQQQ